MPRICHALAFNLVTFHQNGKKVFNWPSEVGSDGVEMLSTEYTSNQKSSAQGIEAGNNSIAFGFVSSLLQEFAPGNLIAFHKKHHVFRVDRAAC